MLLAAVCMTALCFGACGKKEEAPAAVSAEEPAESPEAASSEEPKEEPEAEAEAAEEPAEEPETETAEASAEEPETAAPEESAEELPAGAVYGYGGDDPVETAVYRYMAEEVSKNYEKAEASIPIVNVIAVDYTNEDDVIVYGDFWVDNYNVEGDVLKCVSGGNYPGVMHLKKDGDDSYTVARMDVVADGADFDDSAKELFGEHYEEFMTVLSDSDAREELRKITVTDYVNYNGLSVSYYQDEGWDPVELYH